MTTPNRNSSRPPPAPLKRTSVRNPASPAYPKRGAYANAARNDLYVFGALLDHAIANAAGDRIATATRTQIARWCPQPALPMPGRTVDTVLLRLRSAGVIVRIGSGKRAAKWFLPAGEIERTGYRALEVYRTGAESAFFERDVKRLRRIFKACEITGIDALRIAGSGTASAEVQTALASLRVAVRRAAKIGGI